MNVSEIQTQKAMNLTRVLYSNHGLKSKLNASGHTNHLNAGLIRYSDAFCMRSKCYT